MEQSKIIDTLETYQGSRRSNPRPNIISRGVSLQIINPGDERVLSNHHQPEPHENTTTVDEELQSTETIHDASRLLVLLGNVAEIQNFLRITKINLWSHLATREEWIYIPL